MSNINDTITYGTAKFKVVKNITSENIKNIGINGNSELEYLLRKNNTTYNVGDIAFSANLPSNLILKCITAGTTSSIEPNFSMVEENDTIIDGSAEWICKKLLVGGVNGTVISIVEVTQAEYNALSSDAKMDESMMYVITNAIPSGGDGSSNGGGVPLAAIIPWDSDSSTIPPGFLECDGSAVSRTEYADLFGAIGTKYGAGDGSTTFNLPDYTDGVFLEGSDTAGTAHAAGLPNIEGEFLPGGASVTIGFSTSGTQSGALGIKDIGSGQLFGSTSNSYPRNSLTFDASESNAIYGNSTTVQPNSSTVRYLIKFLPSVPESETTAAASASAAQAAAQAAESYAGSAGIPVGTLFPFAGDVSTPPTGFLACDGSAVSRTMYPDLFSAIGTTYGPGDGSTTFNLPDEEFLKGMANSAPVYGDGNPLKGSYRSGTTTALTAPIVSVGTSSGYLSWTTAAGGNGFNFVTKASGLSSGLYTDLSNAPEYSSNIHYIIKAYDGVTPGSAGIDLTQYASALNGKASRGLDNLNGAGEARFAHVVVDSYYDSATGDWWRQYADGWIEQGGYVQNSSSVRLTVNLLKPMADTKYCVMVTRLNYATETFDAPDVKDTKTTNTFEISNFANGTMWVAFGQGASA